MNSSGVRSHVESVPVNVTATNVQNRVPLRVSVPIAMRAVNIHKSYRRHGIEVPVLQGVDLQIVEGQFTAIVGQSGSGKSTLLHLLGTLDRPDKGEIWCDHQRIDNLAPKRRERLRNQTFGMIFQFYHLLPELTTLENVLVPKMIEYSAWQYWRSKKSMVLRAKTLLDRVGLSHRLHHKPNQLSGGEMQRVAIARGLMSQPSILLADEPTGNLDRTNGQLVLESLFALCRDERLTVVMVTHDESIAKQADCRVQLCDGRIVPG
ncbi:MAG TPA: ABC transporter ATP-binding protein [Pirellulaceae bacterium]|nr:ABC transporter ATP-binding protein [Pirellulaceae bacterium]